MNNVRRLIAITVRILACCSAIAALTALRPTYADDDLSTREQRAIQAAVDKVAPSVVGIETVGGLERVDQVLLGTGPTTGMILTADGYLVSSAFNFVQKPSSIIVTLADGKRLPAQLVATDHSRMLVLLKVENEQPLPVPEASPEKEVQVGWWAIALGRAFDVSKVNVSVGIVSAVDRLSGKAIQTDAKISPVNYGGPLVDIRGRVMGVLSPLSPQKSGEVGGVEWYDSGIGFAVPLEHIQNILPRWKEGDLKPGLVGVSLQSGDIYADAPVIAAARPNSPAYKAGLKAGDKIVAVGDRPVARSSQLLDEVHRRYARDKISLTILRGEEKLVREMELVDHLDPYQRAFLGLLPQREIKGIEAKGVVIRHIYGDSPAKKASLQIGDLITALAGKPVKSRDDLVDVAAAAEVGQTAAIEIRRGEETLKFDVVWQAEPETVPDELPAESALGEFEGERPAKGRSTVKVPELKNEALAFVPDVYDPRRPHALVVWLHPAGEVPSDDDLLNTWRPRCEQGRLLFLAPKSVESGKWQSDDFEFIRKAIEQLRGGYNVDPLRVVVWGEEAGGLVAYFYAFNHRESVRGVAALRSPIAPNAGENDPVARLDFFVTNTKGSRFEKMTDAAIKLLRQRKFAVTVKEQPEKAPLLGDDELAEVLRWIDSLDKI